MCEKMYKKYVCTKWIQEVQSQGNTAHQQCAPTSGRFGTWKSHCQFSPPFQSFFSGKTDVVDCRTQKNKGKLRIRPGKKKKDLYKSNFKILSKNLNQLIKKKKIDKTPH